MLIQTQTHRSEGRYIVYAQTSKDTRAIRRGRKHPTFAKARKSAYKILNNEPVLSLEIRNGSRIVSILK